MRRARSAAPWSVCAAVASLVSASLVLASCGGSDAASEPTPTVKEEILPTTVPMIPAGSDPKNPHASDGPPVWTPRDDSVVEFCKAAAQILIDGQKLGAALHDPDRTIALVRSAHAALLSNSKPLLALGSEHFRELATKTRFFDPAIAAQVNGTTDVDRAKELLEGIYEANNNPIYELYSEIGNACPGILD